MNDTSDETPLEELKFDFEAFPEDTLFHERRSGRDRRGEVREQAQADGTAPAGAPERRKKERRRRIDPTTFEKQYTEDEIEFMNAMQRFKDQTGKAFPTYSEALQVAYSLGYRKKTAVVPSNGASLHERAEC
jgi:hypothetical protein